MVKRSTKLTGVRKTMTGVRFSRRIFFFFGVRFFYRIPNFLRCPFFCGVRNFFTVSVLCFVWRTPFYSLCHAFHVIISRSRRVIKVKKKTLPRYVSCAHA